jgi:hypothetical protein
MLRLEAMARSVGLVLVLPLLVLLEYPLAIGRQIEEIAQPELLFVS